MEAVSFKLPANLIAEVDALAAIVRTGRSQLFRHCLIVGLAAVRGAYGCDWVSEIAEPVACQGPAKPAKLPAPAGETYTSSRHWRGHIRALYSDLTEHFGQEVFRIRELRRFMEDRVELLPLDLLPRDGHSRVNLSWHQTIYDSINVKPQTWGEGGPLIVYVGHDRWRMVV